MFCLLVPCSYLIRGVWVKNPAFPIPGQSEAPLIRGQSEAPLIRGQSEAPLIRGQSEAPLIRGVWGVFILSIFKTCTNIAIKTLAIRITLYRLN